MDRPFYSSLCVCFIVLLLELFTLAYARDYRDVIGPCDFVFPTDHGAHPDFQTEWWYYTGNLGTLSGERYGFQLTFFRTQLAEPGSEKMWPQNPSAWRTKDLFLDISPKLSQITGQCWGIVQRQDSGFWPR